MSQCLIAVGANLGDRSETVERAVAILAESAHFDRLTHSAWHETAAVGGPADQPTYLNGAILVSTSLSPLQVLLELQAIEQRLGRERAVRWGARTIDLDLLLYDDVVLSTPELTLPHPRMAFRKFVTQPAAEVAPEMLHPLIGWTMRQLDEHLAHAMPYVAITGAAGVGKSRLAAQLAERFGARRISGPDISGRLREPGAAPGLLLRPEIEWIERAEPLVRRVDWPDRSQLAVSDFWLEQALAYGSVALATYDPATNRSAALEEAWNKLLAAWNRARASAVGPKLLVLVDPPAHVALVEPLPGRNDCLPALVQGAIIERWRQPKLGPVLRLTSADPTANFAELAAAIAAMQ